MGMAQKSYQISCILYYFLYHQKSYIYVHAFWELVCIVWKREYNINRFIKDNTYEYVFDQLDRMQITEFSLKEEHDKSSDIEQ